MKNTDKNQIINKEIKVSIIIPVYNREFSLVKSIDSALNQTYKNCEIIIIDDGSTDYSINIIDTYSKLHDNIYSYRQHNRGASSARNFGLKVCRGNYILFLDSDDILESNHIEKYVNMINCHENNCVYGPWSLYIDHGGMLEYVTTHYGCKSNDLLEAWLEGWWVASCSILWPKKIIDDLSGWNETLLADQDGDIALRALVNNVNFIYCGDAPPSKIINYKNECSISQDVTIEKLWSRVNVLHNIENILKNKQMLNKKYKQALCVRYYNYAQYFSDEFSLFSDFCYREYKRLGCAYISPDSHLNCVVIKLFGVGFRNFLDSNYKKFKKIYNRFYY